MSRAAMAGAALAAALSLLCGQAQAGQDVPPPGAIRPVQPVLAAASPTWPADRYIPVVGFDAADCRPAEHDDPTDDGWSEEVWAEATTGFADSGPFGPDSGSGWETMR